MILDTNAYSALARGLRSITDTVTNSSELNLPLPVIAELRYGFVKGSQPDHNEKILQRFLAQSQISILMPTLKTTELYAELKLHCSQKGRALSHNDIWIAVIAQESGDTLITFDQDFSVLSDILGDRLIILSY